MVKVEEIGALACVVSDFYTFEGDGLDGGAELRKGDNNVGEILLLQRGELRVQRDAPPAPSGVRHVVVQPGKFRARHRRLGHSRRVEQIRPPVHLQRRRRELDPRNLQHLHRACILLRRPSHPHRHWILCSTAFGEK